MNKILIINCNKAKASDKSVEVDIDFSIYNNLEKLNNYLSENNYLGKHDLIYYFYNGKLLMDKVEIDNFDKPIICFLINMVSSRVSIDSLDSILGDNFSFNISGNFSNLIQNMNNQRVSLVNNENSPIENGNAPGQNSIINNLASSFIQFINLVNNNNSNSNDEIILENTVQNVNAAPMDMNNYRNQYAEQIANMRNMGFTDENEILNSLIITGGNLEEAIEIYLGS